MKAFMKNKRIKLGIAVVVIFASGLSVYAAQDTSAISVLVSNFKIFVGSSEYNIKDVNNKDIKILNEGGVAYAPIRAISEAVGKNAVWDAKENKITLEDTNEINYSFEYLQKTKFPLIAAIPEKNIQLYGINPRGVVLYNNGVGQPFDWDYITPRGILPQMATGDFNKDGKEEIGVSLYWGSGTGISIEQLHVLEIAQDKFGDDKYIDNELMEDDYVAQIKEIVQYSYKANTKMLTLQIQDKSYEFQLETDFKELNYSSMVDFEFENNIIKAYFPIGVVYVNMASPQYELCGTLVTTVMYNNGKFTLVKPKLDQNRLLPM